MKKLTLHCDFDIEDRIEFFADDQHISIDVFGDRDGETHNLGLLLTLEDAKELLSFLQKNV